MKRTAIVIRVSKDGKRKIAVDDENAQQILDYIKQDKRHTNKFNDMCNIILDGLRIPDLYDKENVNKKCKHVTAMKFFKGQENDRIYCQEVSIKEDKIFIVVAAELLEKKKTQKNTKKEINLIEKVATYEYEIKESN